MASIKKIKFIKISVLFALTLLLWQCANQLPPGGGEVDRIPPEIIETSPVNGTTNFHGQSVDFNFSEYIDKNSINDAIFISPAVEGGVEYDWSGKTLTMNFIDSLQSNMTYIITVGTKVADLNNRNKMKSAYNLTFSTGSKIDIGEINGKVFTNTPQGVMIFAYLLDSNSVNPSVEKPDYVSQIGSDGKYSVAGLAFGKYLVFAIKDEFKNLLYNIGEDKYGVPNKIITLSKQDSVVSNINFLMTMDDTIKPNISNVTMTDRNHLMIEFTEFIDSSKVSAGNFSIYDSTANKNHSIEYFYKGKAGIKKYFASFRDKLNAENEYYLLSDSIVDNYGNVTKKIANLLVVSSKPDTVANRILNVTTGFKKNESDYNNTNIRFNFEDGFRISNMKKAVTFFDSRNNSISFNLIKNDDASFSISPKVNLRPKANYKIEVDLNKVIDAAGNKIDSFYTYKFKTISDLYFSGVSGKIVDTNIKRPVVLELKPVGKNKNAVKYILIIRNRNKFDFKRVLPGKYKLWGFIDEDSNRSYNFGRIFPFEHSEQFVFYPDTLNLRARWPVGDIFLKFN